MRGFPLINLLAVLAALTALLVPLLRLNSPARAEPPPVSDSTAAALEIPVRVSVRFAREPLKLELKAGGEPLVFPEKGLERETVVNLPLHDNALEFDVSVTWPEDAPGSVAEITVAPDGREERRQNVWADGAEASEIVRFEWRK